MNNQQGLIDQFNLEIAQLVQLVKEKKLQEADIKSNQLRQMYPQRTSLLLLSADLKLIINDQTAAFQLIDEAMKLSSDDRELIAAAIQQINLSRIDVAEYICRVAASKYPDSYNIFNIWGVVLKHQRCFAESIEKFQHAIKINSNEVMAFINMGNTYMAWLKYEDAFNAFNAASVVDPTHGDALRLKALALIAMKKEEDGLIILKNSIQYAKNHPTIFVDLCAFYYNRKNYDEALKIITAGRVTAPNDVGISRTMGMVLRQVGRCEEAIEVFNDILKQHPRDVEAMIAMANLYYYSLGKSMEAKKYYDLAYSIDPNNVSLLTKLCHFLMSVRNLPSSEGENLDQAYKIAIKMLNESPSVIYIAEAVQPAFLRLLDYDSYDKLGDKRVMIDYWVNHLNNPTLAFQMSRVKTMEDRLYLLDAHRRWGREIEEMVGQAPLKHKVRQRINNKIRIGILSSDLRNHPVGYFTWPIIEYLDRSKFEIFCYSFYPHQPDNIQDAVSKCVDKFQLFLDDHPKAAAQTIADDSLDIMFELGGSTFYNKIDVCAYKPAPVQVSWLGYPHSIGLPTTIDYIMVDPYINPKHHELLIEKPFIMPNTWVSLDKVGFVQKAIANVIPEDRNGYLTFGCLNMPHKLTPQVFAMWAYIMNMVPNSRFLYVRPETETTTLRNNFCRYMREYGISSERISFVATRKDHLDQYNNIDIALDPFPHTGGTTTCESLWMGVPVVSLVGPAFFERLSYSNLNNAGLSDLCAFTLKEYKDIVLKLVQDKERRRFLRHNLRGQIMQHPLGKSQMFAHDFGDTVIKTIGSRGGNN